MKQQQKNEKKAATIPKAAVSYQDQKALKSLQNKLSNLEAKISDLEMAILKQDKSLEDNYDKTTSDPSFFNTYQDNKKQLQKFMKEWETVSLEID